MDYIRQTDQWVEVQTTKEEGKITKVKSKPNNFCIYFEKTFVVYMT